MANIYDMSDTWNDAGTTFKGIGLNVTDTTSASDSLLLDLQVGGVSKFSVDKYGSFSTGLIGARVIYNTLSNKLILTRGTSVQPSFEFSTLSDYQFRIARTGTVNWTSGGASLSPDLTLARDAANTLAQRNGTNAQTFNLYNTYTDASNYERGFMRWSSNVLEIGTEAAGTGSDRATSLNSSVILMANIPTSDPVNAGQLWNDAGTLKISAG